MTALRVTLRRWGARGDRSRPRRRRLPRPGPRTLVALLALVLLAGGGFLWLRHSSLVAVRRVTVTGVSGAQAGQIRSALVSEARTMTTLDVSLGHLRTAVSPYPVVKRLDVSTEFPHGMRIRVTEQVPVAVIVDSEGRRTTVAADGTLLPAEGSSGALPAIAEPVDPGGTRVTGAAAAEVALLAAAPYQLLPKIASASSDPVHGLTAQLRDGPALYFGSASQLALKWTGVADVLAEPGSAGAAYIDVTVPSRPAAGVGSDGGSTHASTGGSSSSG